MSDPETAELNPAPEAQSAPSQASNSAAPAVAPAQQSAAQPPAQPPSSSTAPGQPPSSGPVVNGDYEVQPGESVDSISFEHGLFWETVWNHPNNQQLKQERKNPNVLLSGDKVFIPDIRTKQEPGATEKRHRFKRKGVPAGLEIVLRDSHGKPRPNVSYILEIDSQLTSGKTDAQGRIKQPIPPNADKGRLTVGGGGGEVYNLRLGNLDPITSITGIQQRLRNLGFYSGAVDGQLNDATIQAIKPFQAKFGFPDTGKLDDPTRDKLQSEHGS
jgi:hypothetical protein